jgi:hypothetical protein
VTGGSSLLPASGSDDGPDDGPDDGAIRRLPRRSRRETRELLLAAGTLLADQTVRRTDDQLLAAWLSDVRLDDVLVVGKRIQLYLAEHRHDLDEALAAADDDRQRDLIRRTWFRDRRDAILAVDASGYRDIAKSVAYTVFDHERDYREQLARELLAPDRVDDIEPMAAAHAALLDEPGGPPPFEVLFSALADAEFRRVRDLPAVHVEMGAVPYAGHPLLRSLLSHTLLAAADADDPSTLGSRYRELLGEHGWELRPGVTGRDLVVALYAVTQGYLFVHRVWPEGVAEDLPWGEGTRSAFSLAAEGILRQFAQPVDP